MPEVSSDAAILIAISWQALSRVSIPTEATRLCDCTIIILFAGFFIEANINEIVEHLDQEHRMKKFLKRKYPGLQDKLAWFYNEYVARKKVDDREQLFKSGIKRKIRRKFPGFTDIYQFRNNISHGIINETAHSLEKTLQLRKQAKDIVDSLFDIIRNAGHDILRNTTYWDAILSKS